jgi:hypothetical protein
LFKYAWIIPLQHKFDFANAYLAFKHYVSRQFNKQIKIFYSNGGGESINSKLASHFLSRGMIHQVSCFYTPKQTGIVEIETIQHKLGLRMKLKTIKVFTK